MPVEYTFTFPLPNGLHARPASHLESAARAFAAAIDLTNTRTGGVANAKSVLSMVALDVRLDDGCRLRFDGPDEQAAATSMQAFVRDTLPACDDEAVPAIVANVGGPLPRSLVAAGLDVYHRGTPVSVGIGIGTVVAVGGMILPADFADRQADRPDQERRLFDDAVAGLLAATEAKAKATRHPQESAVLAAHVSILRDVALADRVGVEVDAGRTAAQAVHAASLHFGETLKQSPSAYLRERALDVEDVCGQLIQVLLGHDGDAAIDAVVLGGPSVVVADHLTPGQFLGLDRGHLRGLVLTQGGTTSHTVILARSMAVPTVVGVADACRVLRPGTTVVVDADLGVVVPDPAANVRRYYDMETRKVNAVRARQATTRNRPGMTADGRAIEVAVNVASAEEVPGAMEAGAQGIGLFRTEMIFMDRPSAPTEAEQTDIYTRAVIACGHPVIIRTLDAGGDKPVPYLNLPAEANPFLGYRAVRFYADFAPMMREQFRAILAASTAGQVRILVPMICCIEEVRLVKAMLAEVAAELESKGQTLAAMPQLGVMVEVPAVAFLMDALCDEVDFFSIGSNDLTQYFLAADRDNKHVASLYSWAHPAFVRLLKSIVDDAHRRGKWVGLCGELADVPAALPLLVGLGLDELSVSAPRVAAVKAGIACLRFDQCRQVLEAAIACRTRAEVEKAVREGVSAGGEVPLMSVELLQLAAEAVTKSEAIKLLTDSLAIAGRTDRPRDVEEAVWKREETYSTGLGYGFAVPHCKTDALTANSVAIAKFATPIEWGSLDEKPVDIAILLAVRASDHGKEHMRIFSQLARLVMRDEFRDRLRAEADPAELLDFLNESLGLKPKPA